MQERREIVKMPGAPGIDPKKAAEVLNLDEAGYNPTLIAKNTGVTRPSVYTILARHGKWGEIADKPLFNKLRQEQKLVLEAAYRSSAATLLERALDEDKLAKASTYQLVFSSGIALDKSQLLAGEPTEMIGIAHLHEIPALDRLATILSQRLLPSNDVSRETIEIKPEQKQEVKT